MKKMWMGILCISLCLGLSGCALVISPGNSNAGARDDTDEVKIVYTDKTPDNTIYDRNEECPQKVRIILYHQYGIDMVFDSKTIKGAAANTLVALIEGLEENGKVEAKISDEKVDWDLDDTAYISAESGTMWIEIDDALYRTSWDFDTICRVEEALGEGVVLNLSEECAEEISDAWFFYPSDYWSGTYENGELRIGHVYAADTDVIAVVKKLEFGSKEHTITLELESDSTQGVKIRWESYRGDHIGTIASQDVSLVAGIKSTVTLTFVDLDYSSPYSYSLDISVDNTRLDILIHSK